MSQIYKKNHTHSMEELDLFPQEKEMYHHVSEIFLKVWAAW